MNTMPDRRPASHHTELLDFLNPRNVMTYLLGMVVEWAAVLALMALGLAIAVIAFALR